MCAVRTKGEWGLPGRLGTTSYIYPADILPNVRRLAGVVEDVELVLFEVDGLSNLPSEEVVAELRALANQHRLSYTVHLPLDLRLCTVDQEERRRSLEKVQRVIRLTRPLDPWGYVLHLDLPLSDGEIDRAIERRRWANGVEALDMLAEEAGGAERICLENAGGYLMAELEPFLAVRPVSLCVDVGHLWKDGEVAAPIVGEYLPRTRVVHLHGVAERDHQSLAYAPRDDLLAVLRVLAEHQYEGVITVEVFSAEALFSSLDCLAELSGNGDEG